MRRFLPILAIAAFPIHAEVIGVVNAPDGSHVQFHNEPGKVCVGGAFRAEFVDKDGSKIGGCYIIRGGSIWVTFFDTDAAQIPINALQKPI